MPGTIVIGAGVSGLAAAVELDRSGADFVVLEASDEAGGAIRSHRERGYTFEDGPTSVLDSDGAFAGLCGDLSLEGEIISALPTAKERWIWHDGALEPIPSSPGAFMRTSLLGFTERLRFLKEPFIAAAEPGVEESVTAFVERRFGKGAARFAGAVVSGIYAGDPDRLSLDAAFPEIRRIERVHGSLLKGAALEPRSGRKLQSLRSGLGRIPEAARAKLGSRLRTRTRVVALEKKSGGGIAVTAESGGARESLEAASVIVATPASAAAPLLGTCAPKAAALLGAIEHASLALVQLGLSAEAARHAPEGFGFLVPRGAGLESLGWVFLSRIFEGRAPAGSLALIGFFGGKLAPRASGMSDADLAGLAVKEIGRVLGSDVSAAVEVRRVVRWKDALPQYGLGHGARVASATTALSTEAAAIKLAGNYLAGVSVPACIASGKAAARR